MPRVTHHHHSSASSVEISGGESDTSSSEEAQASPSATYSEGKTPGAAEAAAAANARDGSASCCPAPVRMAIGVFSTLAAVAGAAVAIVGGDALNSPGDPQADLHRIMLGTGFAVLGLGACGAVAAFAPEKFSRQATPA